MSAGGPRAAKAAAGLGGLVTVSLLVSSRDILVTLAQKFNDRSDPPSANPGNANVNPVSATSVPNVDADATSGTSVPNVDDDATSGTSVPGVPDVGARPPTTGVSGGGAVRFT